MYIKLLIGLVLFGTLVLLTYYPPAHGERLIDLIFAALIGLGITHLGSQPSTSTMPDKQAGFASLAMLVIVAALATMLTGCAGAIQAAQAYGSVAVSNAKATNDAMIEAQKVTFCGLPLSAVARHPEIIPAVRTLCVASNDAATSRLLDAIEQQAKPTARQ